MGGMALALWVSAPDPLHGETGRPRKLTESKNSINPLEYEYFPALELWVAVPDPLTWRDRNPTEAHGS